MVAGGEGGEGIGEKSEGNKRCKLPVIREISHDVVVYNTGNVVNFIVISWHGDR